MQDIQQLTSAPTTIRFPKIVIPRHIRRLSDKIFIAFDHACDQRDYEIAKQLLRILEMELTKQTIPPGANRRKNIESLVAAHERLWMLRHEPEPESHLSPMRQCPCPNSKEL